MKKLTALTLATLACAALHTSTFADTQSLRDKTPAAGHIITAIFDHLDPQEESALKLVTNESYKSPKVERVRVTKNEVNVPNNTAKMANTSSRYYLTLTMANKEDVVDVLDHVNALFRMNNLSPKSVMLFEHKAYKRAALKDSRARVYYSVDFYGDPADEDAFVYAVHKTVAKHIRNSDASADFYRPVAKNERHKSVVVVETAADNDPDLDMLPVLQKMTPSVRVGQAWVLLDKAKN
ncbi:hypothetical protein JYU14_01560 [Simkania negevensis]|uniref:Uncharacterized protein n=1 Tax=Simkania negevensis TaxID=83561 RepID=A0ABS3APX2_9BACT|nr:hypothetical protein [Simkania negevensis]